MTVECLTQPDIAARHGFFTRRGGVSSGHFESLNCSLSSADDKDNVLRNRALVAQAMGVSRDLLLGVSQVHGTAVAVAHAGWETGRGPQADAIVTCRRGLALCVVTADCAPVLFADSQGGVVGVAHAGWRGAVAGVLEQTVLAMEGLGAVRDRLRAVVGPCIAQASYEVGSDMREAVLAAPFDGSGFFSAGSRDSHWQFDLPGYCLSRLANCGVAGTSVGVDTCADEVRFFSHRRRMLRREKATGHQISVIVAE